MKESSFKRCFQKEHIDKNENFPAGSVALGMPDHNNCVESLNGHQMRKLFTAALKWNNDRAKPPIPLPKIIKILREELIPSLLSMEETAGFKSEFETTAEDRRLAKENTVDPFLLEVEIIGNERGEKGVHAFQGLCTNNRNEEVEIIENGTTLLTTASCTTELYRQSKTRDGKIS